jgi:filamentous hemagglutinin
MLRLLRPLTTLLGLVLLTANAASTLTLASAENRASGSAAVAEHLVGNNTRLSEDVARENLDLRYDLASDSPVAAKAAATVPGRVLSRINISNAGWAHVLESHFLGSGSRFSIGEGELRSLLGSRQVVGSPVVRTLESADGTRFLRQVDIRRTIGVDRFTGTDTSILSILSDKFGNLVTTFPGVLQ